MKWVLFIFSLVALFVANNALFWLPGAYGWFNVVASSISIFIAGILAWFSSKQFVKSNSTRNDSPSLKKILAAPPSVIWMFVIALFGIVGLLKIFTQR